MCLFQVYGKVIWIYEYACILFQSLFHYRLLQAIEYSPLCYAVDPCLPILYVCAYLCSTLHDPMD